MTKQVKELLGLARATKSFFSGVERGSEGMNSVPSTLITSDVDVSCFVFRCMGGPAMVRFCTHSFHFMLSVEFSQGK